MLNPGYPSDVKLRFFDNNKDKQITEVKGIKVQPNPLMVNGVSAKRIENDGKGWCLFWAMGQAVNPKDKDFSMVELVSKIERELNQVLIPKTDENAQRLHVLEELREMTTNTNVTKCRDWSNADGVLSFWYTNDRDEKVYLFRDFFNNNAVYVYSNKGESGLFTFGQDYDDIDEAYVIYHDGSHFEAVVPEDGDQSTFKLTMVPVDRQKPRAKRAPRKRIEKGREKTYSVNYARYDISEEILTNANKFVRSSCKSEERDYGRTPLDYEASQGLKTIQKWYSALKTCIENNLFKPDDEKHKDALSVKKALDDFAKDKNVSLEVPPAPKPRRSKVLGGKEAAQTLTSINLNQEQLNLVEEYFKKNSETVIRTSPELTIKSLQTLKPEGWLDDAVIMSYLSILQQEYPNEHVAIWDSQWINNFDQLNNYLSKQKDKLRGTVFFPLNNGRNHWYFAKIDNSSSIITVYNSLKTCKIDEEENTLKMFANKLRAALALIKKKGKKKVLASDFRVVDDESYPQQTDSFNCGVYTLMGIDALWMGNGVDAEQFKTKVDQVRKVIAYTLIKTLKT